MILQDGYFDVPKGKIAMVVTHLEMTSRPTRRDDPPGAWTLRRIEEPDLAWYRRLFRQIGEEWLWNSRLQMSDAELGSIIHSPAVEVYSLMHEGRDEGLLELDFRTAPDCEIAFFGVAPLLIGTGAGRWLMNRALERAWSQPIQRLWLHTCSLDHPGALAFYQRSGFRPFRREVEIATDPRVAGMAPRSAAKHIPVIE